jgi:hypothetical protein
MLFGQFYHVAGGEESEEAYKGAKIEAKIEAFEN